MCLPYLLLTLCWVWGPTPARTSATAEISISAPLSAHALRFCATSPQGSGGVEEARHLHTAHYITSHTKAVPSSYFPTHLLAQANVDKKSAEVVYATTFAEEAGYCSGSGSG